MKHFATALRMACAAANEAASVGIESFSVAHSVDSYGSMNFEFVVSNRYDHLGRRVQKIAPEATHTYFYDGWLLVKEVVERSGDTRRCGVSPRRHGGAGSSTSLGEVLS